MKPETLDASFEALDGLAIDTLALFIHPDRLPLRGAAGIVDWRLCGALSTALKEGGITGKRGERLLLPTHGKVGPSRLLIFGAGPAKEKLPPAELEKALQIALGAGAKELAVELPENVDAGEMGKLLDGFRGKRLVVLGESRKRK